VPATDNRPLTTVTVIVPGDLETRTGGYGYDRRMISGLRAIGWKVRLVRLDATFPCPTAAARVEAAAALTAIPDGEVTLIDGLALGALPEEAIAHGSRLPIVALVHHPLALETGLSPDEAATLEASERRALTAARHVVVTSRATAATLVRFDVDPERITPIEPGTDPAPLARIHREHPGGEASPDVGPRFQRGRGRDVDPQRVDLHHDLTAPAAERPGADALNLLCVATLTPRKGYDVLLDALASVAFDNWTLRCAGSADRDEQTTARVRARLADPRLGNRVELVGDLAPDALGAEYDRADVFVLATLYEGYGMAVAEALARGLPVVSTATGAIADLVGADAGVVVAPGNRAAFAEALMRVLGDRDFRARLAAGARCVRDRLPTWDDAAARMADVLARAREVRRG
jgi:glycosyltransferase involved in cell wall biosynthesis